MRRSLLAGVLLCLAAVPAAADIAPDARPIQWQQCQSGVTNPVASAPAASAITTGGTAQALINPALSVKFPLRGLLLYNPSTATLQGIAGTESLYLSATIAAGTTVDTATTNVLSLEVQTGTGPSFGPATLPNVNPSVIAVTNGHKFTCWFGQ